MYVMIVSQRNISICQKKKKKNKIKCTQILFDMGAKEQNNENEEEERKKCLNLISRKKEEKKRN